MFAHETMRAILTPVSVTVGLMPGTRMVSCANIFLFTVYICIIIIRFQQYNKEVIVHFGGDSP